MSYGIYESVTVTYREEQITTGMMGENPGKSMRHLAKDLQVSEGTIGNIVHQDLGYKSYVLRRDQFISTKLKILKQIEAPRKKGVAMFQLSCMSTKFPPTVMIFSVVKVSEGHIMTPPFFPQGLRINADPDADVYM
ncbi:hypothetical protein ACTXT7_000342 [Hymenolepis weldensis]